MGLFDKFKNKDLGKSIVSDLEKSNKELEIERERVLEHTEYLKEFKSIIDTLSELDKKYAHLTPGLQSPRNEDGSIDYSKMSVAYRRHIMNFKETIFAIYNFSRIPSMLNNICKNVEKDNRRLDKKDFIAIKEAINKQLDRLESLCCVDYDYSEGIRRNKEKCDESLNEVKEELNELESNVNKIKESKTFG